MTEVLAYYSGWHEEFHCPVPVSLQGFLRIEERLFLHNVENWSESRSVGL